MYAVACLVIWLLSSMRDMSKIKPFAPLGCLAAVFIMVVVLLCASWDINPCTGPFPHKSNWADPGESPLEGPGFWKEMPETWMDVAKTLPLLAFALNASWAYLNTLKTLEGKTTTRTAALIGQSILIIFVQYFLLSAVGYFTFCNLTSPNILDSLGEYVAAGTWRGNLVCTARAALALQLTLCLPMRFIVTRDAAARGLSLDKDAPAKRMSVSFVIVGSAVACAVSGLPLDLVLGVVSSICASLLIYILPAIIDLTSDLEGKVRKALSACSLVVGLFVMFGGLAANLSGGVQGG